MPRIGLTDITTLIDRSGSMDGRRWDTLGGFKVWLDTLRKGDGTAQITLVQFDDQYEINYEARPLDQMVPLTEQTYQPRGSTALLDALGQTIVRTGERLRAMPEDQRPEKVIFQVITDGLENASTEYSRAQVAAMVTHQQDVYHWLFQFMGTNMDAIAEGGSIGTRAANSMTFTDGKGGVRKAYAYAGQSVNRARASSVGASGMSNAASYTVNEREDAATADE